jgi:hypothetical protein
MQQTPNNSSTIANIIWYPVNELHNEIHYSEINRDKKRSIARVSLTIFIAATLIFSYFYIPTINNVFVAILQTIGISAGLHPLLSSGLAILASVYMGTYLSKVIVRSVCKLLHGAPDFYLTEARAIELSKRLTEELNTLITPADLQKLIGFCRQRYRSTSSGELGANPEDWKKNLENLIYYGDIEYFVEQQQTCKMQKTAIETKLAMLVLYEQESNANSTQIVCDESTPLLSNRNSRRSSSNVTKQENFHQPVDDNAVNNYKNQLQDRKSSLSEAIFQEEFTTQVIFSPQTAVSTSTSTSTGTRTNVSNSENISILPKYSSSGIHAQDQYIEKNYLGYLGENSQLLSFKLDKATADGDCGFSALGMNRIGAADILLKNLEDNSITKLIGQAFYHAWIDPEYEILTNFVPNTVNNIIKQLNSNYEVTINNLNILGNNIYKMHKDKLQLEYSPQGILEQLRDSNNNEVKANLTIQQQQELVVQESIVENSYHDLLEFLSRKNNCRLFIDVYLYNPRSYIPSLHPGIEFPRYWLEFDPNSREPGILEAIARANQINVRVWTKGTEGDILTKIHEFMGNHHSQEYKDILYNGRDHFDSLIIQQQPEVQNAVAAPGLRIG